MEKLPSNKHPNNCNSVQKRAVQKVNKCIQVDLDAEEESLHEDESSASTAHLPERPARPLQPPHTSGNTLPSRLLTGSASQGQYKTPPPPALLPPPLPPPLPSLSPGKRMPPPPLLISGLPPPLPPPCSHAACDDPSCGHESQPCPVKVKTPTLRMKRLDWQKLPSEAVKQSHSMWASVTRNSKEIIEPDYTSLEKLFCDPQTSTEKKTVSKLKKSKEVTHVNTKKSLLLNIFLKQFKCSNEEIVTMIQKGDTSKFDAEALKQLIKLLPEKHEIESLKSCKKAKSELANADQFYLLLLSVPSYSMRIQCMLLCEETRILLDMLRPKAQMIRIACETLLTSRRLPIFCWLILKVGNFLNYGRHTGDAGGFKMSTLLKLTDTKANQNSITLLHHILEEIEKNHTDLLQLPSDLDCVAKIAGINFEVVKAEAGANIKKLLETEHNIASSVDDLKVQYGKSIQDSIKASKELEEEIATIEKKKAELADYLCEDRNMLSLEDVFNTMKTFRDLFIKARKENQERKEQAAKAEKRKKLLAEEEAKRQKGECGIIIRKGDVKPEAGDISALLADIRKGSKLQRTHRNVSETKILPKTTTETAKTVDQSSCILAATAEPSFK
ncbi:inverted formin-2 isoform X1 [Alligator mississippiensis]|uniref:inverted formin-2 isoform X1 n=1 Tax=Alligator mississippiensis TaxID=8496 RepID=UPI002877B4C8|nr:inverted formin-2 isoform X1 [Alligator mississippiensis]